MVTLVTSLDDIRYYVSGKILKKRTELEKVKRNIGNIKNKAIKTKHESLSVIKLNRIESELSNLEQAARQAETAIRLVHNRLEQYLSVDIRPGEFFAESERMKLQKALEQLENALRDINLNDDVRKFLFALKQTVQKLKNQKDPAKRNALIRALRNDIGQNNNRSSAQSNQNPDSGHLPYGSMSHFAQQARRNLGRWNSNSDPYPPASQSKREFDWEREVKMRSDRTERDRKARERKRQSKDEIDDSSSDAGMRSSQRSGSMPGAPQPSPLFPRHRSHSSRATSRSQSQSSSKTHSPSHSGISDVHGGGQLNPPQNPYANFQSTSNASAGGNAGIAASGPGSAGSSHNAQNQQKRPLLNDLSPLMEQQQENARKVAEIERQFGRERDQFRDQFKAAEAKYNAQEEANRKSLKALEEQLRQNQNQQRDDLAKIQRQHEQELKAAHEAQRRTLQQLQQGQQEREQEILAHKAHGAKWGFDLQEIQSDLDRLRKENISLRERLTHASQQRRDASNDEQDALIQGLRDELDSLRESQQNELSSALASQKKAADARERGLREELERHKLEADANLHREIDRLHLQYSDNERSRNHKLNLDIDQRMQQKLSEQKAQYEKTIEQQKADFKAMEAHFLEQTQRLSNEVAGMLRELASQNQLKTENERLQQELVELQRMIRGKEQGERKVKQELEHYKVQNLRYRTEIETIVERRDNVEKDYAARLRAMEEQYRQRIRDLELQNDELSDTNEQLESEMDRIGRENQTMQTAYREAENARERAERQLGMANKRLADLAADHKALLDELQRRQTEIAALRNEMQRLNDLIGKLGEENANLIRERDKALADAHRNALAARALQEELTKIRKGSGEIARGYHSLKGAYEKLLAEREKNAKQAQAVANQYDGDRRALEAARRRMAAAERKHAADQAAMNALQAQLAATQAAAKADRDALIVAQRERDGYKKQVDASHGHGRYR